MKAYIKIFIAFLCVFLFACNSKKEDPDITDEVADRALAYYDSISYEFRLYQPIQQKFIDKLANAQMSLIKDKNATVDTAELFILLDTAWASNKIRLSKIERITEIDTIFNYKAKVISYIKHFNILYEKEFKDYIYILGNKQLDRLEKYNKHLSPRLFESQKLGRLIKDVQPEFKKKYRFTTPEK